MTGGNAITDLLATPLTTDWTIEGLAEQLLSAIAAQSTEKNQEVLFDANSITDRQSRRILRPLLACLATKSAAEAGTPANLYGSRLSFKRPGTEGDVWIIGQFENRPGRARLTLRGSSALPESSEATGPEATGCTAKPQDGRDGLRRAAAFLFGTLDTHTAKPEDGGGSRLQSGNIDYTYTAFARILTSLGMRCVKSHPSPPCHLWMNPDSGLTVAIPDLDDKALTDETIDKAIDALGLTRADLG